MKKVLSLVITAILVMSMTAGCSGSAKKTEGKVYNIYCWNTEFKDRFTEYFEKANLIPAGVTVNWVITPNENNAYQNKLDEVLLQQKDLVNNDKIDLFLVEADYALKYVNSAYTLDVKKDIGLTDADVAGQYQYTKDIVTAGGVLKGVSWQACPGGFIYRRSIAKAVLGSDDPATVQAALSDWAKFDKVAADAKAKGYFMLSGYDDAFRVFSNNMSATWVTKDQKIVIDPSVTAWVDQTKTYTDKGFNNKAALWSAESSAGMGKDGKVLGYFGPGWFFDFVMAPNSLADAKGAKEAGNGSYGDWGLVKGPQGFFWGGTWLCGATGSDNTALTQLIMKTLTCDKKTLTAITEKFGDFTNNVAAMEAIATGSYKNTFLGGQNHISVLLDSAKSISMKNISAYDQGMNEEFQKAFKDYFDGKVTKDVAQENFFKAAILKYPNLSK